MAPERGLVGATLGRYRIVAELGRGGMAVVYRGEDTELGRAVAVKVMHAHLESTPDAVERFRREARAVAALRHPGIVEIYDYAAGDGPDRPAMIVTELIEGPSLKKFVERSGSPLPEVAGMIGAKVARALAAAHAHGIIHRDIKPENLLIDAGGRLVLTDFGIARVTGTETMTETGALVGSPAYMSPEQARGEDLDARSDVFSCGTLLYQLATGALPFVGKDALSTALAILKGDYAPPVKRNPRLGAGLERVIRRCLHADRARRFADAGELAAALEAVCAEDGLADLDTELKAYFADPPGFNRALEARVLEGALARARAAAESRQLARALAECNRILAIDPDQREAEAIVARLGRGADRRRLLLIGGAAAGVVALAVAAFLAWPRGVRPGGVLVTDAGVAGAPPTGPTAPSAAAPRADAAGSRDGPGGAAAALLADAAASATPADARPGHRRGGRARRDGGRRLAAPPPPDAAAVPSVAPLAVDAAPRRALAAAPQPVPVGFVFTPWCDLSVDGRPLGRVPPRRQVRLLPGAHRVVCTQEPVTPIRYEQVLTVEPGRPIELRRPLVGEARFQVALREGDRVRIAGRAFGNGVHRLRPGSYKAVVLKDGAVLREGVVEISAARTCVVVDLPRVGCRDGR